MIHWTIIYEEGSISILSSTTWKELGSPNLVPASSHILTFNKRNSESLRIFPHFTSKLGGTTICIDVMVV